jgi:Holliday junction resolvase RusA-like endonuclease
MRLAFDEADPYPDGRLYCPVKPDWDNLAKSCGDGLKKGKVIREDSRFVDGRAVTLYGRPGERPFVEIYIFAVSV